MRSVLVRCLAAGAAASLLVAVLAVPLGHVASGHTGSPGMSMSISCPSGAACGMNADCSGTCPVTVDGVPAVRDTSDLQLFHLPSVNLLLSTVTLDLQKPPPKLS